jgi:hypothetical protein
VAKEQAVVGSFFGGSNEVAGMLKFLAGLGRGLLGGLESKIKTPQLSLSLMAIIYRNCNPVLQQ